ncbi:MAG TPA: chemotaxis protein CheW [Candidatus Ozemobacteraceae bacterium]|nr:chemotaxis protein CheW [Candidatus Ozemobacteraceae bacterium]
MSPVLPFRRDSDILERIKKQGGRTAEDTRYLQLVTVRLGGTSFAVDALAVAEILIAPPLIDVPATAPLLSGVVNIRGNIIPVFDPRPRLNIAPADPGTPATEEERRLLVFRAAEGLLGMIVDDVTLRLSDGRVPPRPPDGVTLAPGCARMAEIGESLLPLLEIEVVLTPDERRALSDVKNSF